MEGLNETRKPMRRDPPDDRRRELCALLVHDMPAVALDDALRELRHWSAYWQEHEKIVRDS